MDFPMIITSAAVGAVAASFLNLFAQWLERKSRVRELLLAKAVELATERVRFVFEVAKESQSNAKLSDPAVLAATYYQWLTSILRRGKLPPHETSG